MKSAGTRIYKGAVSYSVAVRIHDIQTEPYLVPGYELALNIFNIARVYSGGTRVVDIFFVVIAGTLHGTNTVSEYRIDVVTVLLIY